MENFEILVKKVLLAPGDKISTTRLIFQPCVLAEKRCVSLRSLRALKRVSENFRRAKVSFFLKSSPKRAGLEGASEAYLKPLHCKKVCRVDAVGTPAKETMIPPPDSTYCCVPLKVSIDFPGSHGLAQDVAHRLRSMFRKREDYSLPLIESFVSAEDDGGRREGSSSTENLILQQWSSLESSMDSSRF